MRIVTAVLSLLVLVACSANVLAGELGEPMFNGKDLTGWVVEGKQEFEKHGEKMPIWSVEDGHIVCAGNGYGFLRYDTPVCDFVWHVEYKPSKGCNSGLGIRSVKFMGSAKTRPSYAGYEMQILDDAGKNPTKHSTGSLYRYVAPTSNPVKPAPEWNTVDVECIGAQIRIKINGELVQDVKQSEIEQIKNKPVCGYLSLQNHGKQIEFRNLRLKVLKAAEPEAE